MSLPVAAIQDVTNFLRSLLKRQLMLANLPTPDVTLLPPGNALPNTNGANLYLYRVVESPFSKNQDWRGNRMLPPASRPVLGLQLSYLITPLAPLPDPATGDLAQLSLGVVMLTLHENPILNDVHLPALPGNPPIPAVDADDLPDYIASSYEKVKVTLLPTTVDEISRIWATLNQPYRLSVAYEVSLVELIPTAVSAVQGGIVLSTNVDVVTTDPPRLVSLSPPSGALAKRANGDVNPNHLRINGFGLVFDLKQRDVPLPGHRQLPVVRIAGQAATIDPTDLPLSDQSLAVTLPLDLDAGPHVNVSVVLNGRSSTPLTFTVTPWLASMVPIRSALDPAQPNTDLKLTLEGNGFGATPSILFTGQDPVAVDPGGTDGKVSVTIPALPTNGLYDVRLVKADGSVSNARKLELLPLVSSVTPSQDGRQLTIVGARLNGDDIRLSIDGAHYVAPSNTDAARLIFQLTTPLQPGPHRLMLSVDGHVSRPSDFAV